VISRVGFFQFVKGYGHPIPELEKAIDKSTEPVMDSLIVLPEGFNIGKRYDEPGQSNYQPNVLRELRRIALEKGVAFVAGLIVKDCVFGRNPPYSSARLIVGRRSEIICFKHNPDGTEVGSHIEQIRNYRCCRKGLCDRHNPGECDNVTIAALICRDWFTESGNKERHETLRTELSRSKAAYKVVCVPAHTHFQQPRDLNFDGTAETWKGCFVILANSHPSGEPSFIKVVDDDEIVLTSIQAIGPRSR